MHIIFRTTAYAVYISAALSSAAMAQHQDDHREMEELIVTMPAGKGRADTSMPVHVLGGEALRENAAATLGDTLNGLAGVTSASFGPGVGSPVIRGQSGNRVGVLQNGLGVLDASTLSPDHANSVEPLLAERIEVVRGPSTLLYGNGAIGGVVNIIDNRIPETLPGWLTGAAELRYNTVANETIGVFKLDGATGSIAWHLDRLRRERANVEIPGSAINEKNEDDEPARESVMGFIENSAAQSTSSTAGASWIGEHGYIGASVNALENNYGIPPGPHAHPEDGEEQEPDEADIRIDMKQTRFNIKGGLRMEGFLESLEAHITFSDYEHREIESADDVDRTGAVFSNDGREARILLRHRLTGNAVGTFGLQAGDRKHGVAGEEAFIPASNVRSLGVFAVESIDSGRWLYELGLRLDNQAVRPGGNCGIEATSWSGGASAIWRFRDDVNLLVAFNRSERAATVEELFSNIQADTCAESAAPELAPHAASGRFEIGNPGLRAETSRNLELALRKHAGRLRAEVSLFYNRIGDYIFLVDTGLEIDETGISRYLQEDARFSGMEAEISLPFEMAGGHMDLTLFSDYVKAELASGGNAPRIPPPRFGAEISFLREAWNIKLRATAVDEQSNTGPNETPTESHTLATLYFDYHLPSDGQEAILFIKGNNLLNEEIRNHASLIKDFAPEPGIGIEAGLRVSF